MMSDYIIYEERDNIVIRNVSDARTVAVVIMTPEHPDHIMYIYNAVGGNEQAVFWAKPNAAPHIFRQLVDLVERSTGYLRPHEQDIANRALAVLGGEVIPPPPDDDDVPF